MRQEPLHRPEIGRRQVDLIERLDRARRVQQPDDDFFTELRRQRRDPQIDPPPLEPQPAASVLRLAALRDVHAGNDLQPRDRLILQMVRNRQHVAEQPIDPVAHLEQRLLGLDVNVARARGGGVAQNEVDQPDNRRQLDVFRERRRIDDLVFAVAGRFDFSRRIDTLKRVIRIRQAVLCRRLRRRVNPGAQILEARLGHDDRHGFLARPEPHVLKHRIVHRVRNRQPEQIPVEAERNGAALPAEVHREQLRRVRPDNRRLAVEVVEMQSRRDRGGHDRFIREPQTGQRPADRRAVRGTGLGGSDQCGAVDHAGADQRVADKSIRRHE